MTDQAATQRLAQERAVFKQRTGQVDWYWSAARNAWIAKQWVSANEVTLRVVQGDCGCNG